MDNTLTADPNPTDQQQVAAETTGTEPAADLQNQQPDGASLMEKPEEGTKEEAKEEPQGAPEAYEAFAAPEGVEIDEGMQAALAEAGKEANLTQKQMQSIVDKLGPEVRRQQMEKLEAVSAGWAKAAKEDPEFGGKHLGENLGYAKKAYETYFDKEARKIFRDLRLENNLAFLKPLAAIGRDLSEDRPVAAQGGNSAGADARAFYPNSQMNR